MTVGPGANHAVAPGNATVRGLGLLAVTCVIWGVNWPVMKFLIGELPPLMARSLSGLAGTAVMLAIAAARREALLPPPGQWRRLCRAALLNITGWMGLTILSLVWLTASEATILAYTLPIWTSLLAWPLLGERPTAARGLGLLLGLAGVALLTLHDASAAGFAKWPGVVLALAGSMTFALGTVLSKRSPLRLPPLTAVAWQTGLGTLPLLLGSLLFERADFGRLDELGWLALAYNGLLVFSLSYLAWFEALRLLPASLVTIGSLLVPVVGVLSAALLLGEPVGLREIGALGLTLAGVALAMRSR